MTKRAADIIAERLFQAGCRHAFGIPGGEVLTLIDALERAGIRFVLVKHENAAGFMAEGVYHATGAPGILVATVGPGIANGVNAVANASQEHIPLIVLSGCIDSFDQLNYTHQVFNHAAVLNPLCKASFLAVPDGCDIMIDKALAIATDGQPGPVHIDLPIAVAASPHVNPARRIRGAQGSAAPVDDDAMAEARAMFHAAQKPVLLVGADALHQPDATTAIRSFASAHGVPVVTTYKAKGIIDESDPLSLGGHGLSPKSDAIILPVLGDADLIICAGYDPIEMRSGWRDPWAPDRAIEFSMVPNTHYMHHTKYSWVCSIASGLAALEKGVEPTQRPTQCTAGSALRTMFNGQNNEWGPVEAIRIIRAEAPAGTVLTLDSGAHRILASQMWTCSAPRTLLQSTGLCTMGCGLPLATGYSLAAPGVPVIALMGDAGLDMGMGELTTLRDLDVGVTVIVFVDGSLSLIEAKQRATQLPNHGVDFGHTDYAAVATALGISASRVADGAALREAVARGVRSGKPSLIAVEIPRRCYDGQI